MTKYLALSAAVAMLATPAFAQSNDSNLQQQSDVVEGARQSQEPGIGTMQDGRSSTLGGTNDSNLETQKGVLEGAEVSSTPGAPTAEPMGSRGSAGSNTNSGNLGQ
jgi:hypothetical protein